MFTFCVDLYLYQYDCLGKKKIISLNIDLLKQLFKQYPCLNTFQLLYFYYIRFIVIDGNVFSFVLFLFYFVNNVFIIDLK